MPVPENCSFYQRDDLLELANASIEQIRMMGFEDDQYGLDWREVLEIDGEIHAKSGHRQQFIPPTVLKITIAGYESLREATFRNACAFIREPESKSLHLYTDLLAQPISVESHGCAINASTKGLFFFKAGDHLFARTLKENYAFSNNQPIGKQVTEISLGADVIVGGSIIISFEAPRHVVVD